jgi:hypothetical protein
LTVVLLDADIFSFARGLGQRQGRHQRRGKAALLADLRILGPLQRVRPNRACLGVGFQRRRRRKRRTAFGVILQPQLRAALRGGRHRGPHADIAMLGVAVISDADAALGVENEVADLGRSAVWPVLARCDKGRQEKREGATRLWKKCESHVSSGYGEVP